jgi:hypothetical protein
LLQISHGLNDTSVEGLSAADIARFRRIIIRMTENLDRFDS